MTDTIEELQAQIASLVEERDAYKEKAAAAETLRKDVEDRDARIENLLAINTKLACSIPTASTESVKEEAADVRNMREEDAYEVIHKRAIAELTRRD